MNGKIYILLCLCVHGMFCASSSNERTATTSEPTQPRICSCKEVYNGLHYYIFRGQDTKPHEYPQMVSVRQDGDHQCGGSIINKNFVLTARHCVKNPWGIGKLSVEIGRYDFSNKKEKVQVIDVKKFITYDKPELNGVEENEFNDIAILELRSSIKFSKTVRPTCLSLRCETYENKILTAVGWGHTSVSGDQPNILQKVDASVIPLERCRELYSFQKVYDSHICTQLPNGGSSTGPQDSGGPVFSRDVTPPEQVAIISQGKELDLNVHIGHHKDFIIKNTEVKNDCQIYSHDGPFYEGWNAKGCLKKIISKITG